MKLSRRNLFLAALGGSQLALLSRFGLGTSRAAGPANGPTKLLSIYVAGGLHWETFFTPLTGAGVTKFLPAPVGGIIPLGYQPSQVENFDRTAADMNDPGPRRKLRGPIYWNWANPKDTTGAIPASGGTQNYRPYGYSWADPALKVYEKAALLVGADQGTAAHQSGVVASMSGVAGATFRSPAVQAVVANAMAARFPNRPIPNIGLGGVLPVALGLPSLANPVGLTGVSSVEPTLSDRRDSSWKGLRTRTDTPAVGFDGSAQPGTVPSTIVDRAIAEAIRAERGTSTAGSDALLGQLYDTYSGHSRTIARDVLSVLGKTKGWEYLSKNPNYPTDWTSCIGSADSCGSAASMGDFDFALQLLKSDLVTSVNIRATSFNNFTFDTHASGGPQIHTNHLHIAMEQIGRVIAEMSLTPTANGRTLLDDTIVYVYSDFGRTFPKQGSDHHPATCAIIAGGGIIGNQMVGGYDETMSGSPMGAPAPIVEEAGSKATRPVFSQDIAATVLGAFYLEPGKDFFIPGGYGIFDGVIRPA